MAGMYAAPHKWGAWGATVLTTHMNMNREHPEYIARKAMWRQYKDLYAGGQQLREHASEYLARRHKEPNEVYFERLSRVFYENYIGSIIDWFGATLMRREPNLTFDGTDTAAKCFYGVLADNCDLKGTNLSEFFRQRFSEMLVSGSSYIVVDFPRAEGLGPDAWGRRRIRTIARISGQLHSGRSDQLELRSNWGPGLGGDPDILPAAIQSHRCEMGKGNAVDLL